jgi:hypothetical protein
LREGDAEGRGERDLAFGRKAQNVEFVTGRHGRRFNGFRGGKWRGDDVAGLRRRSG